MSELRGHCLCGAVRVTVSGGCTDLSVCHCDMCRRWSGAATWGVEAPADVVAVSGLVTAYRSSEFATRAFCPICGTHLWIRDDGRGYDLMPGLFDALRDAPLTREVYSDRAFAAVPLAGEHARLTREAYEREHPFVKMEV